MFQRQQSPFMALRMTLAVRSSFSHEEIIRS